MKNFNRATRKNQKMNQTITDSASNVITTEANALITLAQKLPKDFKEVVKLILQLEGHVIISGIGKSGHIGRKIAATLASTGTPSHFVHATEASHGDLGALTRKDACLLISNSGETVELADLVSHAHRFSIPLIAISSNPKSSLIKASDFKLCLPKAPEACSIGLAPTTSTTMTLALGDALAVTLMQERKFSPEHFQILHPGGKLGSQVTTVDQLMHQGTKIPVVKPYSSMPDTLIEMTSKGFGVAIISENNTVIGIITDGDLRRHMDNLMQLTAQEVGSNEPITIQKDSLAVKALSIMNKNKINVIIVINKNNTLVGILHIHDCLRAGLT
jgi:arabinose-5-phosphate isomerase